MPKVQVKSEIIVESVYHMSTPQCVAPLCATTYQFSWKLSYQYSQGMLSIEFD
jgi:hypothetical protein